jgi:2-phosphosulfolactate phosphatase
VLTGAFVNLSAVAGYIRARSPEQVSLVRMGHEGRERCVEDDLYARCLLDLLEGRDPGLERVPALLREAPAARKFFDPACEYAPEGDFAVCADVDRYGFVLRLRRATGAPAELERVDPPWIAAA